MILSLIRNAALVATLMLSSLMAAELDYTDYARLLKTYVSEDGVRYSAWSETPADVAALDLFLERLAEVDLQSLERNEQKAFYINLYNAAMLQAVLDNAPSKSVKQIGLLPFSIFKKKFIELNGRQISLDEVEKGILLKDYFDPRIHFAVNCASESCPPLREEPYCGKHLEAQLEEQTRLFAASDRAARKNAKGRYAYSELFKWYNADFAGEHPAQYLNQYRAEPLPVDQKFDWISYDWSLNATK